MKRRLTIFCALLGMLTPSFPCFARGQAEGQKAEEDNRLIIYAYDSFVSEWGPGPRVASLFEEAAGITVDLRSVGDSGQLVSRIILEKDDPQADLVIGIDNNLLHRIREADVLEAYRSMNIEVVPEKFRYDSDFLVTPYDYGYFAINYDSERLDDPPTSLEDLTKPKYQDSLILMDPRTSGPGLGFLLWTVKIYGKDYRDFWRRLMPSILTIADGWDSGYALYTSGEAPMVLSYTTSPPYHVEYEGTTRYRAALFEGGNYLHIEGMGILKGAPHREAAERFIDFMLTPPFQEVLPLTNFMYPINEEAEVPSAFDYAPEPEIILNLDAAFIQNNREELIQKWVETVTQ